MTKKKAEWLHAKRRALERYGLNLTSVLRDQLRGKIKRGEGTFVEKQSRRVSVWRIAHENKIYLVVYDKDRKEIITFLPNDDRIETLSVSKDDSYKVK